MTLRRHEYERIRALADCISSLAKRGLAQYETLPVDDHLDFQTEIGVSTKRILDTIQDAVYKPRL